jgi:hypothetical protein
VENTVTAASIISGKSEAGVGYASGRAQYFAPFTAGPKGTFTILKNRAATEVTCTTNRVDGRCSDTAHSATFAVGDTIALKLQIPSSSLASAIPMWTAKWQPQ